MKIIKVLLVLGLLLPNVLKANEDEIGELKKDLASVKSDLTSLKSKFEEFGKEVQTLKILGKSLEGSEKIGIVGRGTQKFSLSSNCEGIRPLSYEAVGQWNSKKRDFDRFNKADLLNENVRVSLVQGIKCSDMTYQIVRVVFRDRLSDTILTIRDGDIIWTDR